MPSNDLKQLHLTGDGFSWRGVRLRPLTPDDMDEVAMSAARDAQDDTQRFIHLKTRGCLVRMIAFVTPPDVGRAEAAAARKAAAKEVTDSYQTQLAAIQERVKAGEEGAAALLPAMVAECAAKAKEQADAAAEAAAFGALQAAKWMPVTALELTLKAGPNSFSSLFTPKDATILGGVYRNDYEARYDEAQAIMGKALAVSGG